MLPMKSVAVPINSAGTALRSGAKPSFGTNPYEASFAGLRGGFDPGMQSNYRGYNTNPTPQLKGMGACGCGPVNGCTCGPPPVGMAGMGQTVSLDQLIANATNWLTGVAQSSLPASASVPPGYGSAGGVVTQLMNWAPYLLIGYLAYKVIK